MFCLFGFGFLVLCHSRAVFSFCKRIFHEQQRENKLSVLKSKGLLAIDSSNLPECGLGFPFSPPFRKV